MRSMDFFSRRGRECSAFISVSSAEKKISKTPSMTPRHLHVDEGKSSNYTLAVQFTHIRMNEINTPTHTYLSTSKYMTTNALKSLRGCLRTPSIPLVSFFVTGVGRHHHHTALLVFFSGRWTSEEHCLFLKGLDRYGKGWKQIATLIQTRTVVQIR